MSIERVCVVGGGAIGSLYAAHLSRVADVWVLTRRSEHARALEEQGLEVSGRSAFTGRVRWVQIDIDEAAEDLDHLITPEERLRVAMARQ